VARAKRTSRADARRRYRAQLIESAAETPTDEGVDAEIDPTAPAAASARRTAPSVPSRTSTTRAGATRPATDPPPAGMRYAFRAAFHPANIRDDLAHLPELLRSRAVIIPIAISVGTAVAIAASNGTDVVSRILAQYFLVPPPIGSIFIAGFFARRASYLAGFIVGLAAALALTILVVATPALGTNSALTPGASASPAASAIASASPGASASSGASASPGASATASAGSSAVASANSSAAASASSSALASPATSPSPAPDASPGTTPTPSPTPTNPVDVAGFALITSPLAGIIFASAAAWYRRFLQLSNPNRRQPPPKRNRPNTRRR
jgi:hypothetical protein